MPLASLASDASAAVDLFNPNRPTPPPLETAGSLFLPLPILGELLFGVLKSSPEWRDLNRSAVQRLAEKSVLLLPDIRMAEEYARIRTEKPLAPDISRRRETHLINDLWTAALCVQHDIPLLTNDRDFEGIAGLTIVRW